jgi:hypothetical protein
VNLEGGIGARQSATSCLHSWRRTGKPEATPKPHSAPANRLPFPGVPQVILTNWREALHRSGVASYGTHNSGCG